MEQHLGDNFKWKAFEAGLKKPIPDRAVNYNRIEQGIFRQIRESSEMGTLSQLKADAVFKSFDWDNFENALFHRIAEHEEYDEPVDEYIRMEESLPLCQWERLEAKVESGMLKADNLREFEHLLKTEKFLLFGQWEEIEKRLFQRISAVSFAKRGWVKALREDKQHEFTPKNHEISQLSSMMGHVDNMAIWERRLSQEQYLDADQWETIEKNIFDKIERHKKFRLISKPTFWFGLDWFVRSRARVRFSAFLAVFLGMAFFGRWQYLNTSDIPTLVYRAQGSAVEKFKQTYFAGSQVVPPEGAAITLVNQRGFIELQNGTGIKFLKASKSKMHFKIQSGLKKEKRPGLQGSSTFFVSKSQSSRNFLVTTPDYDVQVTGTYFKIQPDIEGRYTTQVLEGTLNIIKGNSQIKLTAGQTFSYNYKKQAFSVENGGTFLYRNEIKQMPQVEDLQNYPALEISTNIPNAEVHLNGIHMGQSPLAVLHPPGRYSLQITLGEHQAIDTAVTLELGMRHAVNLTMKAVSPLPDKELAAKRKKVKQPKKVLKTVMVKPEKTKDKLAYAESMENSDWRRAIEIYHEILSNETSTGLEKENALFSTARLKATNYRNKDRASKDFLQYLALYPDGAFAGESWLRLAEIEIKNQPEKAISYYLRFFKKYPYHHRVSELQHRVGLIYLQLKKYNRAVKMFEEALSNLLSSQIELQQNIYTSYHTALMANGELQKAEKIGKYLNSATANR